MVVLVVLFVPSVRCPWPSLLRGRCGGRRGSCCRGGPQRRVGTVVEVVVVVGLGHGRGCPRSQRCRWRRPCFWPLGRWCGMLFFVLLLLLGVHILALCVILCPGLPTASCFFLSLFLLSSFLLLCLLFLSCSSRVSGAPLSSRVSVSAPSSRVSTCLSFSEVSSRVSVVLPSSRVSVFQLSFRVSLSAPSSRVSVVLPSSRVSVV